MDINWPQLIAGSLLCLFGWAFYWVGLHAAGIGLGAFIGALSGLGLAVFADPQNQWTLPLIIVGMAVGGGCGFFLIKRVHYLAFFLIGAVAGILVAALTWEDVSKLSESLQQSTTPRNIYAVVCAVAMGLLMAAFSKHLIILITALIGTILIVLAVSQQQAGLAFIPVFIASLIIQVIQFRHFARRSPSEIDGADAKPDAKG